MNFKKLPLYLISAILMCCLITGYDIANLYWSFELPTVETFRELLHAAIFVLFLLHLFNLYKHRELSISDAINKIVQLFLITIAIYAVLWAVNDFQPIEFLGESKDNLDRVSWNMIIATAGITYSLSFLFIKILFYFKTLIYYKRRRNTAIIYRSFFIASILFIILNTFWGDGFESDFKIVYEVAFDELSILAFINLFILINIIVLAFRHSWVTYLSRKSKYIYFGVSILIFLYLTIIMGKSILGNEFENVKSHSPLLTQFIKINFNFFLIYNIFSIIYLILHLPTARVFDRKMKEVQALYNLSVAINTEPDFNKLVLMITNMASEVTEASATWLEIYNKESASFYIASSKRLNSSEIRTIKLDKAEGISGDIFTSRKPVMINEMQKSKAYAYLREWKPDISSLIAVPLITTQNALLGIIYVTKNYDYGFDPDDVAMLEAFSNQVVIALENTKLIKESIQRERLEQELKIAREVQLKLLPQEIPKFEEFDIDAIAFTANEVGGDYFDFIENKNQFGVIVADVSGKGTSAAFYMAELKGIVKALCEVYTSPKDLFCHTNDILYRQLEKKSFITGSIFSINTKTKAAKFVRAGHCPLIRYVAETKSIETYTPKGIGLGLCNKKIFNPVLEELDVDFQHGDIVALYTDGLNEARNLSGAEYGDDKIGEIILKNFDKSSSEIKDAILDDIIEFTGKATVHDDMTLAIIKFV
jgi:serine phosphatase RsbU (regulator of sigma subunit)